MCVFMRMRVRNNTFKAFFLSVGISIQISVLNLFLINYYNVNDIWLCLLILNLYCNSKKDGILNRHEYKGIPSDGGNCEERLSPTPTGCVLYSSMMSSCSSESVNIKMA